MEKHQSLISKWRVFDTKHGMCDKYVRFNITLNVDDDQSNVTTSNIREIKASSRVYNKAGDLIQNTENDYLDRETNELLSQIAIEKFIKEL